MSAENKCMWYSCDKFICCTKCTNINSSEHTQDRNTRCNKMLPVKVYVKLTLTQGSITLRQEGDNAGKLLIFLIFD